MHRVRLLAVMALSSPANKKAAGRDQFRFDRVFVKDTTKITIRDYRTRRSRNERGICVQALALLCPIFFAPGTGLGSPFGHKSCHQFFFLDTHDAKPLYSYKFEP